MVNATATKTQLQKDLNTNDPDELLRLWSDNPSGRPSQPKVSQTQPVANTPIKSLAEAKKEKEAAQHHMSEAPSSFNIKFILAGYECQFTVRGELDHEVLTRAKNAIAAVKVMGADPVRIVMPNPNKGNDKEQHTESVCLCPACKVEAKLVTGTSQKNGKPYRSLKCPQCNEFLPGTFRWA